MNQHRLRLSQLPRRALEAFAVQSGALSATYGLLVTLYLVLHHTVGESWPFVAMLNNTAPLLTLFSVPAWLVTLLIPRYRMIWGWFALPGTLAFVVWYGPLFVPKAPSEAPDGTLKLITYNVGGTAYNDIPSDILARDFFTADLVAFQELSGAFADEMSVLESGKAIRTRFPVIEGSVFTLGRDDDLRSVAAVRALIDMNGTTVAVLNLHPVRPAITLRPLGYHADERRIAVHKVLEAVQVEQHPVILLCDCNFSERTRDYRLMASTLHDAWFQRGWGMGFTAPAPGGRTGFPLRLGRPDQIWHSEHFETLSIEVMPHAYSDHYPVKAQLRLKTTR